MSKFKPGDPMTVTFRVHTEPGKEDGARNRLMDKLHQLFMASGQA